MNRPWRRRTPRPNRRLAATLAGLVGLVGVARAEPIVTPLVADLPGVADLAICANGQTALALDAARGAVVAFDPTRSGACREVVAPPDDGLPRPAAIGCMPGDVVVTVCHGANAWSLRSFRLRPDGVADPAAPLQSLAVGESASPPVGVAVVVSGVRDWLVVAGLPEPLPAVQRTLFAGVGLRPLATAATVVEEGWRPVAAAVSPADELVLVERPRDSAATCWVSYHDAAGRRLLRLDTGLTRVRDVAFDRAGGRLWVVGGEPGDADRPEGLWRLDAELRRGAQGVRPTCVVRLTEPRAVVAASDEALLVATGAPGRAILRIDPRHGRKSEDGTDGEEEGR
ncbi:MAG: hypothetical protein ACKOC8_11105 [Pirellulales bacterium]